MKSWLRGLLIGSISAAALSLLPFAVSTARAQDFGEVELDAEKIQVVHAPGISADSTNINIAFTSFGEGDCDGGDDDAIASGIQVSLAPGSCASFCAASTANSAVCVNQPLFLLFPFDYVLDPFIAHTINHTSYGTFFGLNPVGVGPGTVSARIVLLSTPVDGCGTWNLNLEATGLDLSSITSNPISLWLNDADDSGPFCFDIDDAIIGAKITPAPKVRRGSRRAR
jgi:hypothetical protein